MKNYSKFNFFIYLIGIFLFLNITPVTSLETYGNADYMRTLNRSACIGTIDTMFFNPAGTLFLPDGFYMSINCAVPFLIGKGENQPADADIDFRPDALPRQIALDPSFQASLPAGSLRVVYKLIGVSFFSYMQSRLFA